MKSVTEFDTKTGTELWDSLPIFICEVCGGKKYRIPENSSESYVIRECRTCGKLEIRKVD